MTLPDERTRAAHYARLFLRRLLDPKQTPRVPKAVREEASRILRHYPSLVDLEAAAKGSKEAFSKPTEEMWNDYGEYGTGYLTSTPITSVKRTRR